MTKFAQDRSAVLQKSKTLRGSQIVISEDFPRDVMLKRRHLIKFAKQVRIKNLLYLVANSHSSNSCSSSVSNSVTRCNIHIVQY